MRKIFDNNIWVSLLLVFVFNITFAQDEKIKVPFDGHDNILTHFRPSLPESNNIEYLDLDKDGDPDILKTVIVGGMPIMWIDDDDDMQYGDLEGDMDSDCLLIDRNKDGKYAANKDLVIDWNDEDGDNKADLQVVVENPRIDDKSRWTGHYMCMIDMDKDDIFNFIDWQKMAVESWEHSRRCNFFQDYHGNSIMLKSHTPTFNIDDLRFHWENPFLFLDPDNDGETEMTLRFRDEPKIDRIDYEDILTNPDNIDSRNFRYRHVVRYATISIDLDNDNDLDNELDYDFSLKFSGNGFNYSDQVNKYKSLRGLPEADTFFYDPRWRQLDELIFVKPENAYNLMFKHKDWSKCWFVYDEDDDCQRWERVEFYSPHNIFNVGQGNFGLDHEPQAEVTGDRGEWDEDNSGKGKLYIGVFDSKIHLYGAEWGAWRVDQNTEYYQGWQGWRGKNIQPQDLIEKEPWIFPTIRYADTDENGFFDKIEYDLDGDKIFEDSVKLGSLGISDKSKIIDISKFEYSDFVKLQTQVAETTWSNAQKAIEVANKFNLNVNWYTNIMSPNSIRQKYDFGFWLNFYLYTDFLNYASNKEDKELFNKIQKAYYSSNWSMLLKD